jgi:xylose isomerase
MTEEIYRPGPEHKFTFGLWTVGNRGRDPFGEATRPSVSPITMVKRLSELGAHGVNLHDNDLVPIDASAGERDRIVRDFKQALADYGMKVPMATTNLFYDAVFKDGAFTSNDPRVRLYALQKTMRSMELGAELGAHVYVFWGGREGTETDAAKDACEALKWNREALNFLCEYSLDQGYDYKFALEAKPNEPRGDIYLPTTGAMLGFIATLDHPEMVGVNPEVGHEQMSGLNFYHVVAQAIEANKLFHIDLNDQKGARFDQDLRFGSESIKSLFFLVKLLEDSGYEGSRHFDAHSYRSEDIEGVWEFAAGCMRNYLILKDKARQFNEDPEIQALLAEIRAAAPGYDALMGSYTRDKADKIKSLALDRNELSAKKLPYERLDQLTVDIILGVRKHG